LGEACDTPLLKRTSRLQQAKEAREHKMPTPEAFAKVLAFARERGARSPHTKGSCPAYIAPAMVLAFSARLRGHRGLHAD